ncbi:hypothetical protein PHYSODRAFT_340057 [Phytophthora sojae]|uniref:Uncharacterized protein n=1 Tax=Phytophthora sojae (strain P6497) TaxID=1094619 RepID=G5A8L8_PHYSP|nr:hypothetical protein PHYSODRAFT_340057 [Phytophthora sojae]EGZ08244.1 hypothetical protein PHYSODRAFT_340057 [Phytophthora sojae]|eukprot:XP_009536416.1 hypothetical protein PHYSODRAFT_340057 [Phytophthora sojae]
MESLVQEWDVHPADSVVDRIGNTGPRPLRQHEYCELDIEQPDKSATARSGETNGRNVDEAWLDATTDSVDGYTAVDDGGSGRHEWAYTRVARDGEKIGTQFVHGMKTCIVVRRRTSDRISTVATNPERVGLNTLQYQQSRRKKYVTSGCLCCTFVLKPVIAEFNGYHSDENMVEVVKDMVVENTRVSQLSLGLSINRKLRSDETASKQLMGQLMAHAFRSASGGAINQTSKKPSMRLQMGHDDLAGSRHWWRWLAYGLFSKRARALSSLEDLSLISIGRIAEEDVEAFSAILNS